MNTRQAAEPPEPGPEEVVGERRHYAVSEGGTSKYWQLATLIVPILLTTFLTFWVSLKEDAIKQDIDKQSQLFSQQLQLSEELYKRRVDAYDKLYAQLVQMNARLEAQSGAADAGEWNKNFADQVVQFNELLNVSKLHVVPRSNLSCIRHFWQDLALTARSSISASSSWKRQ